MMKTRNIIISLLIASGLSSCFNLDLTPEGVLSTADPFTTTGEMRNYINQFYESAVLVQNIAVTADVSVAIFTCMGYTVLLCFALFKTSSLSRSVFGAH